MNDISPLNDKVSCTPAADRWLYGLLCLVTFLTAVTTGHNVFNNAWLIFGYEALFVVGFISSRGLDWFSTCSFPVRSFCFWLLVAWFASVTLSLVLSPYGLMMEWFAVTRYFQTLFHIVFFLCLRSFLASFKGSVSSLFLSISTSVFVLALIFIMAWQGVDASEELPRTFWFREPPLNAHIRITGFLVAAATAALAPFLISKAKTKAGQIGLYTVGLGVWGLMFWCSGRGSILSAVLVCAALAVLLMLKKQPVGRFLITTILLAAGGILLAELFKVFDWNGLFQATSRTAEAGGDIYKLATGRPKLWGHVMESVSAENAYVFGLGPQGYCYMSNRTFGFQPHNLFLQFLAEWGIIGSALFIAMLVFGFIQGLKEQVFNATGRLSVAAIAAGAIIVSLGLHSLVDGIFYHAQSSFYLAIAFAVWMVPAKKD